MSFHHAAVSKGLIISCAASSIAAGIFDVKHFLHLQLVPHISRHHQYWRFFLHHFASSSSGDLLLTELLLYNVAIPIERRFGSPKFASFAVITTFTSTVLEITALLLFHRLGLNVFPSGPSCLVFSMLYQYIRLVPSAYRFKVFGVNISDKIFTYIIAFHLAISQPPGSIALALIGILSGQLYRSDVLGLKSFRLPRFVHRLAVRFILPLLGSTRPPRRTNRAFPDDTSVIRLSPRPQESTEVVTTTRASVPSATVTGTENESGSSSVPHGSVVREWVNELTGSTNRASQGLRVPNETEISLLTNMFPDLRREDIVGALQRSPNIEGAVDTLLSSQS